MCQLVNNFKCSFGYQEHSQEFSADKRPISRHERKPHWSPLSGCSIVSFPHDVALIS